MIADWPFRSICFKQNYNLRKFSVPFTVSYYPSCVLSGRFQMSESNTNSHNDTGAGTGGTPTPGHPREPITMDNIQNLPGFDERSGWIEPFVERYRATRERIENMAVPDEAIETPDVPPRDQPQGIVTATLRLHPHMVLVLTRYYFI